MRRGEREQCRMYPIGESTLTLLIHLYFSCFQSGFISFMCLVMLRRSLATDTPFRSDPLLRPSFSSCQPPLQPDHESSILMTPLPS